MLGRATAVFICISLVAFAAWLARGPRKMAFEFSAQFAGANGTAASDYTPEVGTWVEHPTSSGTDPVLSNGGMRASQSGSGSDGQRWMSGAAASDASQIVGFGITKLSNIGLIDILPGLDATDFTCYLVRWFNGQWVLHRSVAGTVSGALLQTDDAIADGGSRTGTIQRIVSGGSVQIIVTVDGVGEVINYTDTDANRVSAAGRIGVQWYEVASPSDTTGMRLDYLTIGSDDPLTAGSVTVSNKRDTSVTVTAAAATGGSTPYSYQWYRSTSSGFTPAPSNIITGATSLSLDDDGLDPDTAYYYVLRVTDGSAATDDTSEQAVTTYPVITQVDNANIYFSPYNWFSDGTGAYQSNNIRGGSDYAESNNMGAYFKLGFSGTSFQMLVDTAHLSGVTASEWPTIAYLVDANPDTAAYGDFTNVQLQDGVDNPINLTGLAATDHTIYVVFRRTAYSNDNYTDNAVNLVKTFGFLFDEGSAAIRPSGNITIKPRKAVVYGDSIVQGLFVDSTTDPTGHDSLKAHSRLQSIALNCEYGQIGWGSQNFAGAGAGSVPAFHDPANTAAATWKFYRANRSRLRDGKLWPRPTIVFEHIGANTGGATEADQIAYMESFCPAIRAACFSTTEIFHVIPLGGFARTGKTLGVQSYLSDSSDAHTFLIDLGSGFDDGLDGPFGTPTDKSFDGIHPNEATHQDAADLIVEAVDALNLAFAAGGGLTQFLLRSRSLSGGFHTLGI